MADVRRYESGVPLEDVGAAVETFLSARDFETEWFEQGSGYLVLAKQKDTVRTIAGQALEATVSIQPSGKGFIVTVDKGGMTSQAIGGALGYVIAGPLGLSAAAYGAYRRHQLAKEVFQAIDNDMAVRELREEDDAQVPKAPPDGEPLEVTDDDADEPEEPEGIPPPPSADLN